MARDEAERCKERAVNLNGPAADSRKPVQPERAEEDRRPTLGELSPDLQPAMEELGAALDAADFAEALAPHGFATGGLVESTVDADHPPVDLGCPEARAGRAVVVFRVVARLRRRSR